MKNASSFSKKWYRACGALATWAQVNWDGPAGTAARTAATTLGLTLMHAEHTQASYVVAFAQLSRDRPGGSSSPLMPLIADFALERDCRALYPWGDFALHGGLNVVRR